MLHTFFAKVAAGLVFIGALIAGPFMIPSIDQRVATLESAAPSILAGTYAPSGGGTYRLGQSVGTSDSSIKLSSFKEPVSNIKYTMTYLGTATGYGTIAPQSSVSEFVSFTGITQNTDGSATITGVTRGLTRTPAGSLCTASTTLAQSHSGQTIFILSDSPCHFAEYSVKQNEETISGAKHFTGAVGFTIAATSSTECVGSTEYCTKAYIDGLSIQGAATSTETNMGIVQLANTSQIGSSTASSTTGRPLVIANKYATTTPSTVCSGISCIVAGIAGKIAQTWLDLTAAFTWSGAHTFNATTTLAGSSVTNNAVVINGLAYKFPSTRAASSTSLQENGSGSLSFSSYDWRLISSTTITTAMASTSVNATSTITGTISSATAGLATSTDLYVILDVPVHATIAADMLSMQFNYDTTSIYAWEMLAFSAPTESTLANTNTIRLTHNINDTSHGYTVKIHISNIIGRPKTIDSQCIVYAGSSAALGCTNTGVWNNSTQVIAAITFGGASNLPVGTNIRVYGSAQ